MDRERVRREYRELTLQTQRLRVRDSDAHASAVHPLNKNKNRYPDVLPIEETRVKLSTLNEIPASDYINANLVRSDDKFCAICSQAPLPHTFDDFWRMVWEQEVPIIIILMRLREQGKVKGHHYWPTSKAKPKVYGDITVSLKKARQVEQTRVRVFELSRKLPHSDITSTRRVVQLHFKGWPDQGVPESTQPIRELVHLMQFYRRKANARSLGGPVLIHCSAGIGRTGTFLAIVFALEKLQKRMSPQPGDDIDESSDDIDQGQDMLGGASTSSDEEPLPHVPHRVQQGVAMSQATNTAARKALRRSSSENSLRSPRLIESQNAIKVQEYSDDEDEQRLQSRNFPAADAEIAHHLPTDVMAIVMSLRKQRNRGMVQNEEQYSFIYRAVLDEIATQKIELSPSVLEFMTSSMKVSNDVGIVSSSKPRPQASVLAVARSPSRGLSKSAELFVKSSEPIPAPTMAFVSARLPRRNAEVSPSAMDIVASPPRNSPKPLDDRMDVDNDPLDEREMSDASGEDEEYDSDLSDEEDDYMFQQNPRRKSRRAIRRAAPGAEWRHQSIGIPAPHVPAPGSPPYSSGLPEFDIPPTVQFSGLHL